MAIPAMQLTWTSPAWLSLLLAVAAIVAAQLAGRTNFNPRQRAVQTAIRSLVLVALVCALARPIVSTSSDRQSIVYAVDVSHSVSGESVSRAAARIEELQRTLRPAHSRIVVFGRTAAAVDTATELRQAAALDEEAGRDVVDRSGTDLEAGLLAARSELSPEHVPRIVLFSDGHATAGDTDAVLAQLAAERIPVFVEALEPRTIGDAWIDSATLPPRVTAGSTIAAAVTIGSQRDGAGTLTVRAGNTLLARRELSFARGFTAVPVDLTLGEAGHYVLTVQIEAGGDPLAVNNTATVDAWAAARPRVLYVESTPSSAHHLSNALTAAGFETVVRHPSALADAVRGLGTFDVVILSDVARAGIPDEAMEALARWVEEDGGGLLIAGGESVFGEGGAAGGYRRTPLERVAPVTFERRDEPEVALVIVLDRSWSMAGSSMELTKTAAQAAVDVLDDQQSIGILTFNDKFAWDVPLRNVGKNRDEIRRKISEIGPGGHTLIYPAVEQAYLALRDANSRARHVILLSDGRSYPGEYEALVKKMVESRITLSTVAVGPSADPDLLRNLAEWGKGRAYVVADASAVPEIFVKEAKNAATPAFDEEPITPVLKTPAFLSGVDLAGMPRLKGNTATVLKDHALEILATDEDDPLLAFWPSGLGRTAVFTSDVKDRWAADWIRWKGYGPFFAAVVRALERQQTPQTALEVVPGPIRGSVRTILIGVEARDEEGRYRNLLDPAVTVQRAGAGATTVQTRQTAPGRYEGTVVADADRPLTVSVSGAASNAGPTTRAVLPDPAAEYRFRPADAALLGDVAATTGGAWEPSPEALAERRGDVRAERRPLWPALLCLALGLWFVDLLLRRIRVFESPQPATGSSAATV